MRKILFFAAVLFLGIAFNYSDVKASEIDNESVVEGIEVAEDTASTYAVTGRGVHTFEFNDPATGWDIGAVTIIFRYTYADGSWAEIHGPYEISYSDDLVGLESGVVSYVGSEYATAYFDFYTFNNDGVKKVFRCYIYVDFYGEISYYSQQLTSF